PNKSRAEGGSQQQAAQGHQPPILRLYPRRANSLVPQLACALIGRLGLRRTAVALHRASKSHRSVPFLDVWDGGGSAAVAALDGVDRGLAAVAGGLRCLKLLRPGRRASGGAAARRRRYFFAAAGTKRRLAPLLGRRAESECIAQLGGSGTSRGGCHTPHAGTDRGGARSRLSELVGGRGSRSHRRAGTDRTEAGARNAPRSTQRTGAA